MWKDPLNFNSDNENALWENALFVFDTSALLNLYEYSENTIEDIFKNTFTDLKDKLWIPFNVSIEILSQKHIPYGKMQGKYNEIESELAKVKSKINDLKNKVKNQGTHPYLNIEPFDKLEFKFEEIEKKIKGQISERRKQLSNNLDDDKMLKKIKCFFKLGDKWTYNQRFEIIKEGEFRFRNEIPPGYKDENKIGFQKYADLIIWKQIIELSIKNSKPIVLITDDIKEDWWILDKNKRPKYPRYELIEEFQEETGLNFWMYRTSDFIEKSKVIINSKINTITIEELFEKSERDINIQNNVLLSASYQFQEPYRIDRLKRVLKFCESKMEIGKINSLHDHKGELLVKWNMLPSKEEEDIIELAWEEENELRMNVIHEVA